MKKIDSGVLLKGVSIVVAAGTLISAIFSKDSDKELNDKIDKAVKKALSENK